MFCGNREGISDLPCSTLVSVNVQCSIELLLILYIVMSFSIMRLNYFSPAASSILIYSRKHMCVGREDIIFNEVC